jgi:expansin
VLPAAAGAVITALLSVLMVVQALGSPACAAPPSAALAPDATVHTGRATYYLGDGSGNCSFDAGSTDLFVALGPSEYAAGAACGSYLDVTGAKGTVRVKVTDQCPECEPGHLDLGRTAFARIGTLNDGIIPITYRTVRDPHLPGPITMQVKDGASVYWLAVRADNHGNALSTVELKTRSGAWSALQHTDYNYWIDPDGAGGGPFTFRLTDRYGHRVTVTGITLSPMKTQRTNMFMYGAGSARPVAAPRSTPASPAGATSASPSTAPSPSVTAGAPSTNDAAGEHPVAGTDGRSCQH